MSNAAKKKPEHLEQPELPNDREEGLSKNFDDPALDGILLDLAEPASPAATLHEAADAIEELIAAPAEAVDPLAVLGQLEQPVEPEANPLVAEQDTPAPFIAADENAFEVNARWEMAERLFELVICELPFPALVENALNAVVNGLGAEAGSVLELDYQKNEFFFRASVGGGDAEQLKAFRVPANKGIVGHVAESRQTMLLRDLASDELQLRAISAGTGFETHTCLAAPLVIAGQLYGVVELFNKRSGGSFTEADVRVLEDTLRMVVKILEVRFVMAELAKRAG